MTRFTIGVELDAAGAHPAAWREADHEPIAFLAPARLRAVVEAAERFGFSFASFEDSPSAPSDGPGIAARLDAIERAAFVSPGTSAIGLVPVADVVYSEPFHLATQLASLDHASRGRAGWIVRARADDAASASVAWTPATATELTTEAAEVVAVGRALWDSWDDDAVIRDRPTGRYIDRDRLHFTRVSGTRFSVIGPSIISRSPQGQTVVFAPAELAGAVEADVLLVTGATERDAVLAAAAARAAVAGPAERPRILVEIEVALDAAGERATDRIARLDSASPWQPGERLRYAGTAEGLTALLGRLAQHTDGVRLHPAVIDTDLAEIGFGVLPALRSSGIHTPPVVGNSLRDILGLARPANRFEPANHFDSANRIDSSNRIEEAS